MKKTIATILVATVLAVLPVAAQETEVKITLNEQFFEALLEAVFNNLDEPKVPLSIGSRQDDAGTESKTVFQKAAYLDSAGHSTQYSALSASRDCDETVRLKREIDGVYTAVRFRNGKILAPIAFEGNYAPPLIGCLGFSGWAETTIDLSFDKSTNSLVGNAKVLNVNLSGTNGIGSNLITRIVQNSIDRKINPLKIVDLKMLSFTAPIQEAGKLRMEAIGIRHQVRDRELDVYLKYRFTKGK
ncbi:MAG: hypothetical protein HKN33_07965 [Pyrinomonadaceae bacterium]|nr:hypothetical protein [Pyrinomonadaceae bacterium]